MPLSRPLEAVVLAEAISIAESLDAKELYASHYARLYRFGLAFSGSESKAAEAVQEAFLDLIRKPSQFDPRRGTAVALLFGMVRNRLRSARRLEREEPLDEDGADDSDLLLHFERVERIAAVREAILKLPEHYREVIVLCEIEECSYEEAAVSLEIPVGTVRSRLNRAKLQLKRRLSEYEGSGA
jgi:RNA polymerase sigma-70 factor (ECF subfamily)